MQVKCPLCGRMVSDERGSCMYCGAQVGELPTCSHCGRPLRAGIARCAFCGREVEVASAGGAAPAPRRANPVARIQQGIALCRAGRHAEAEKILAESALACPDDAHAWFHLGESRRILGRPAEEVLVGYQRSLALDPNRLETIYYVATCLEVAGRPEEATTHWEDLIRLNRTHHYGWFGKGRNLNQLRRHEEALTCLNRALELAPDHEPAWSELGLTLHQLGRSGDARQAVERALQLDPGSDQARVVQGLLDEGSDPSRSRVELRVIEPSGDGDHETLAALVQQGKQLNRDGRFDQALLTFNRVLEIEPEHLVALHGKGEALARMDQWVEALLCLEKVLARDPDNPQVQLQVRMGRFKIETSRRRGAEDPPPVPDLEDD